MELHHKTIREKDNSKTQPTDSVVNNCSTKKNEKKNT